MSTILLFIDGPNHAGASERNCIAAYKDISPSLDTMVDLALEHMAGEDGCRIGVLEVHENRTTQHKPWFIQRFKTLDEVPEGAFYDYRPKTVEVIDEDAAVMVTLPPFVAAFQR